MEERQLSEKQLQALLRLKRHEQPPPGYFDDLLTNIHQRQREELLRRPAWRLFMDRLRGFFTSLDWNYAAAMSMVLLVGLVTIQLALPTGQPKSSSALVGDAKPGSAKLSGAGGKLQPVKSGPTRFVMDPMPASYESAPIRF
jgi:hypothetical protein